MLEELVHFLINGSFADVTLEFGRYLLRKQFFHVHFNRSQIRLVGDNTYENRIITKNLSSPSRVSISSLLKDFNSLDMSLLQAILKKIFIICCIIAVVQGMQYDVEITV